MANFFFVRDPDQDRRRLALQRAEPMASAFGQLGTGILEGKQAGLVWACAPAAPVQHLTEAGETTFLLGDAIAGPGPERLRVEEYARRWRRADVLPEACDGLHIGVRFDDLGRVTVAADLLGLLPVYYTQADGALLVASSPALLAAHPAYRFALDPVGLVGILVTNGPVKGRTVHRGVRRLASGHVLQSGPEGGAVETLQYELPITTAHHGVPYGRCVELLWEALVASCARHVSNEIPHTLLLSGGLDSRLLAGTLVRQGANITAVTMGVPNDLEYRCARGVARELDLSHQLLRLRPAPERFAEHIRLGGLIASSGSGASSGLVETLAALNPRVTSGYLLDVIAGGDTIERCYDEKKDRLGFDVFFPRINAYGVPVDTLRRLLRPDVFGDSLDQVMQDVRRGYESAGDSALERTWRYELQHRQRFFVGASYWRHAFAAWPAAPAVDREILSVTGGVPLALLMGRRLEREVVIRHFPRLAQLPLDHNSFDTTPLQPRMRHLAKRAVSNHLDRVRARLGVQRKERRFYFRTFDFNGPSWREVRRALEPSRQVAYELFDERTFDEIVPGPDVTWEGDTIVAAAGAKYLLGLLSWMSETGARAGSGVASGPEPPEGVS